MNSHARSRPNGRNLLAQGEPLVWLTGGMFAIACAMIVALLGLILYQGLSTLWPKSYVIYALEDGELVGGEWIGTQPYQISRETFKDIPPAGQARAEAMLGDKASVASRQLYLRTGNYDVGNRHFAYVPTVLLQDESPIRPKDLWLVERLEWGVLYGFPVSFRADYAPEMNSEYASHKAMLDQIDRFQPATGEENAAEFESVKKQLQELLLEEADKWTQQEKHSDLFPEVEADASKISAIAAASHRKMMKIQSQLESAKYELGHLDKSIAAKRIQVRKAELSEETDLLSKLDDGLELATSLGTVEQQWREWNQSIQYYLSAKHGDSIYQRVFQKIVGASKEQQEQEVAPLADALAEWKEQNMASLPPRSREAVDDALEFAREAAAKQLVINAEVGRLEWIRGSHHIDFELPIIATETVEGEELSQLQGTGLIEEKLSSGAVRHLWRPKADGPAYRLSAKEVAVADMVRWFEPNDLSLLGKVSVYVSRWSEFLLGEPREAGVEGGFFPAIWGTIVMTLLMSVAVMPFGVMAALYMREYAKGGWVLSWIRISINNLAGVPSIVYGVFGLAFFCYTIGGYIDGGPRKAGFDPWPSSVWFAACAVTVFMGTGAFFLAFLGSGSPTHQTRMRKRIASFAGVFWVLSLVGFVLLLVKVPFFDGFYQATLPNPTFGKGCLLWASCTLALLTLPVVIVATEESLAAVPNSLREGSYACGAGKWQTLQRIVLPYARPGIITGFILSMARGAGEVAPMMLVGAIPLATELPLDAEFPFFHGSRSFMHLGFQIFSLGFQSQNSEAAKPMVFTATLLLLTIVTCLNVAAIWLRARLRKRFQSSQF